MGFPYIIHVPLYDRSFIQEHTSGKQKFNSKLLERIQKKLVSLIFISPT